MLDALSAWLTFDLMGLTPGTHPHGPLTPPFPKGGLGYRRVGSLSGIFGHLHKHDPWRNPPHSPFKKGGGHLPIGFRAYPQPTLKQPWERGE